MQRIHHAFILVLLSLLVMSGCTVDDLPPYEGQNARADMSSRTPDQNTSVTNTSATTFDMAVVQDMSTPRPDLAQPDLAQPDLGGPVSQNVLYGFWDEGMQVGGCIDFARWSRFSSDGTYTESVANNDQCINRKPQVYRCQGDLSVEPLNGQELSRAGRFNAECSGEDAVNRIDKKVLQVPYMIYGGDERPGLSTLVFFEREGNGFRFQQSRSIEYEDNMGRPPENSSTEATIDFFFNQDDQPLETFEQVLDQVSEEPLQVTWNVEVRMTVSFLGVEEELNERFLGIGGFLIRAGDGQLLFKAEKSWEEILREKNIFSKYRFSSGVLSALMSSEFFFDPDQAPAWYDITKNSQRKMVDDTPCQKYGEVYPELRASICEER